jgi:predicted nucleotidyltransferase
MNEAAVLRDFFAREAPREVLAVYLFGSHARGTPHTESDVDVGLVLEPGSTLDQSARFNVRIELGGRLIHALHNNNVDVVVLNDAPPPLAAAAVTKGVQVYCRDARRLASVERDIQLRAADLQPFLRRMERRLLERLGSS